MLVDHAGGLSSSNESIVFLGLVLFQVDFLIEFRVLQHFLLSRCDVGVKHLKLGCCFREVERCSQVADILSSLNFTNSRHRIRWSVRHRAKLFFF